MMTASPRELFAQGQALRLGFVCMYVDDCPDGSCHAGERDQVTLNLTPATGERLDTWLAAGGAIGAQALAPLAALEKGARLQHRILIVGPGSPLPALVAIASGVGSVRVQLHPEDIEPFDAIVAALDSPTRIDKLNSSSERPPLASTSRVLLGCDAAEPNFAQASHWARCLQANGQFVFFGLAPDAATATFRTYAKHGMALAATGNNGHHAYLAGSLSREGRLV